MTKHFFIVIPYSPAALQGTKSEGKLSGIVSGVGDILSKKKSTSGTSEENFEEYRTQLEQRIAVVEQGFVRCGIRVVELGTEEVIELFYKIFNPGDAEKPIQINQVQQQ